MNNKSDRNFSTDTSNKQQLQNTVNIPDSPKGWDNLKWLGPSFLWMLSAAGSGELLFTPRIAALYGYTLLWALLAAVVLKWFINGEVGRFSVCTGATILEGFKQLPGPKNWAIWLILLPQVVVAISTVAGLSGAAATALILVAGGSVQLWTVIIIVVTAAIVLLGQYNVVEKISSYVGIARTVAVVAAAIFVFPNVRQLATGLVPQVPQDVQYQEILPWLGFMLAGAAGLMWYSYWVEARGYGAASVEGKESIDSKQLNQEQKKKLRGWLNLMTISNTLAVVGALLAALSFLILGGELLRPQGLVPKENQVAETLGSLLGDLWGPFGFWFMVAIVFITFCSTVLSVEDGFGRMFADGTQILLQGFGVRGRWTNEKFLQRFYIVVLLVALPIAVYLFFGEPVGLLQTAGGIEAAHIPIVTGLTLYLNHRMLPKELQPSKIIFGGTAIAGIFFGVFAIIYLLQLLGVIGSGSGGG
ncbi:Nramp family divalent metal transporter [Nostoc cf. edaphicum LEGE 07299]|uniref:Nramp family divalent metal transporter n=1 Tax=Nostoc cf. edaphicum LEGE 07299 TaxID=2777974 RepID=A0ABR9TWU1_9NOSO|nr:Nramp family divalent metal transporter [Nostoc edaphicum]MBE9104866.1 Nramp family divalent metal transporter [Nostoc cf. edaphicum LEGE 07299]